MGKLNAFVEKNKRIKEGMNEEPLSTQSIQADDIIIVEKFAKQRLEGKTLTIMIHTDHSVFEIEVDASEEQNRMIAQVLQSPKK